MAEDNKDKSPKFQQSKATEAYAKGQEISNNVESRILGWLPLLLVLASLFTAYEEANFIAWLMPEMPDGVGKMVAFNIVAFLAAIFLPLNFAFLSQLKIHKEGLERDFKAKNVSANLYTDMGASIKAFKWRSWGIIFVCLGVILSVHGYMINFMRNVFLNTEHMEKLGIAENAASYSLLGIGFPVVTCVVHLLLGLLTQVRVDLTRFLPKYAEKMVFINARVEEQKFILAEIGSMKNVVHLQKEIAKQNAELDALRKSVTTTTTAAATTTAAGGASTPTPPTTPSIPNGFDPATPPTGLDMAVLGLKAQMHKFFPKVTNGLVSEQAFQAMIANLNTKNVYVTVGPQLVGIQKDLVDLYEESKTKWSTPAEKDRIWKEIVRLKTEFKNIYDANK